MFSRVHGVPSNAAVAIVWSAAVSSLIAMAGIAVLRAMDIIGKEMAVSASFITTTIFLLSVIVLGVMAVAATARRL